MLRNGLLILVSVAVLVPVAIIYWNTQLDKGMSALKAEDYTTALHKLKPLAMVGDSTAQEIIGLMYAHGWGVPKDRNEALTWLRRSARWTKTESDKAAVAAYYIGKNYMQGFGMIRKDEAEAVRWFKIAAEGGSREAAEQLGKAYTEGLLGLPRDPKQAEHWLNKAKQPALR